KGDIVQRLICRERRIEPEILGQVPEDVPDLILVGRNVMPVDARRAARWVEQRSEDGHQRALAGSVRPEQGEDTIGYLEALFVESNHSAFVLFPVFFDLDFQRTPPKYDYCGNV